MAKRKSKKNSNLGLILGLVALVFTVAGIALFLALDAVTLYAGEEALTDASYNGLNVAFGYKKTLDAGVLSGSVTLLNASVGIIIALILAVAGGLMALPKSKLINLIGGVLLVVAAILFAVTGNLTALTEDAKKVHSLLGGALAYKSAVGAYLGMAFTGLAGLTSVARAVLGK